MAPITLPELTRRLETDRFGPFVLQTGVDGPELALELQRVEDAHERFVASPLSRVASRLEQEVVVSSVFGTNTIEGGTLTEDETATALALDPARVQEVEQQRAFNIKAAYDHALAAARTGPATGLARQAQAGLVRPRRSRPAAVYIQKKAHLKMLIDVSRRQSGD